MKLLGIYFVSYEKYVRTLSSHKGKLSGLLREKAFLPQYLVILYIQSQIIRHKLISTVFRVLQDFSTEDSSALVHQMWISVVGLDDK